jgi:hypothetical protein
MRSGAIAVAIGIGCAGLGMPSAQALPARDLYMVRDVDIWDAPEGERYSGWYYALRQKGKNVVGQIGHFEYDSDNMCLKGAISGHKYRFEAHRGKEEPYNLRGKWLGSGSDQHVKGYRSVSYAQMRVYMMGRDPRAVIKKCAKG